MPVVLKLLETMSMARHRGIANMSSPLNGTFGFVLKFFGSNGVAFAVKVFKTSIDPEKAFLGVNYNLAAGTCILDPTRKTRFQRLLYDAGFVPTVLREATADCAICNCVARSTLASAKKPKENSLEHRTSHLLQKKVHYHVYMPWMDGHLASLLKTAKFSLSMRLNIFLDIAKVMHRLALADVVNPDLKATNVLYRKTKSNAYFFAPCDVGGLYVANQVPVEAQADATTRYLVTHADGTHRFIGKVDADDTTVYAPPSNNETSRPVMWATATYVNPYLKAQGIKSNFDLAEATHLTNQFSLLAFFMELVGISPPTHDLAASEDEYKETISVMPTMDTYLDIHVPLSLTHHRLHKKVLAFIKDVWTKSSNWMLVGTSKTYVQCMMDRVRHMLTLEHASPPRKVLRRSKLETQRRSGVVSSNS